MKYAAKAAEAAEVADVIAFLASPDARCVNGGVLTVYSGLTPNEFTTRSNQGATQNCLS